MSQEITSEGTLNLALETAKAAARDAGMYLLEKLGSAHVLYKKALRDDLLDTDLESEAIILIKLRENFPNSNILSEEAGETNVDSIYQWIIDPLDGSANFQHGIPIFGISIGLRVNNVTTLGVIYLPTRDEMFTAVRGQGATLNGHSISVSSISSLNEAIIQVGDFATDGDHKENERRSVAIARLGNTIRRVRMIGTAATDLAYIACGRADALVMFINHSWDVEAGRLLVSEAGGIVSSGRDSFGGVLTIYGNGFIHHQLSELLFE